MKKLFLTLFLLYTFAYAKCAVFSTLDSVLNLGLPVVIVNTVDKEEPSADPIDPPTGCWGGSITNATKVPGEILVLSHTGDTIYQSGPYVSKTSGMTIKIRGNWSARSNYKNPYKIKLQKKGDLLGRDKTYEDKDWVLLRESPGTTANPISTMVAFEIAKLLNIGWIPSYKYVNLYMNNDYRGIYILCESVSRNSDARIDVNKTKGCIVELDAYFWNETLSIPTLISKQVPMQYTFKYPDVEDVDSTTKRVIQNYLIAMEKSLDDSSYSSYVDIDNWARWLLANDILGQLDVAGSNQFFIIKNIEKDSLVRRGTIWDFDSMYSTPNTWSAIHTHNGIRYFNQLFSNTLCTKFPATYKSIYHSEAQSLFDDIEIMLDSIEVSQWKSAMDSSIVADHLRYPYHNLSIMDSAINVSKRWFQSRQAWMNSQINDSVYTPVLDEKIESHDCNYKAIKCIKNNKLLILKNNITYDVYGNIIQISQVR